MVLKDLGGQGCEHSEVIGHRTSEVGEALKYLIPVFY